MGRLSIFAHHLFTRYRLYGQPLYRDLVAGAMARLLPDRAVQTNLPSAARVSLMRQEKEKRYILHLLYATPVLRGGSSGENARAVEVIEDVTPLHDVHCKVHLPETMHTVRLAPGGEELNVTARDGVIEFCVPRLLSHQMVVLEHH